jgi:hypothetical protein
MDSTGAKAGTKKFENQSRKYFRKLSDENK